MRAAIIEPGHDRLPISINSHAYVAEPSRQASDEYFPTYAAMMNRIGRERGWSAMTRGQFEMGHSPRDALVVGSPEEIVEKLLFERALFGYERNWLRSASVRCRMRT